ncbi:MAG: hypothetical protein LBR81_00275 [Prevotellaceae bacterium]|jgi:hypothetical protein|nr:hypothetical protein [Prevotellaceae bacterium]
MKKNLFIALLCCSFFPVFGQINMSDSTAQVVGYWNKNEKQSYIITEEKLKIKDADTTERAVLKYVVDVTVKDSTANSYTIDWHYRDFDFKSDTYNQIMVDLMSVTQNMTITIKTDEFGAFQEVVNWKDVRGYIYKATDKMKKTYREIAHMDKVIAQVEDMFKTKEAIEASSIEDIQQFYSFHGGKYKLKEENTGTIQLHNIYDSKEPFDAKVTVWLDEINPDDDNYIIRYNQVVDEKQLNDAVFAYLNKIAKTMKTAVPKKEDMPLFQNEVNLASRIHNTGWIIYSVQTKTVVAEDFTNITETIIEIQ